MAEIRPFPGIRFDQQVVGDLSGVVAPPYDVIGLAAQRDLYGRSPYNIIRLELGEQFPDDSLGINRYTRAGAFLTDWLHRGVLVEERRPALYLYRHSFAHCGQKVSRMGFLAAMRLEEWHRGIIIPHEKTMAGPKLDRLQLMRAAGANFSPVFALYEDHAHQAKDTLDILTQAKPDVSFSVDEEEHEVWVVADRGEIQTLQAILSKRTVFVADGHHRYETALRYRDEQRAARPRFSGEEGWNFVMTLLVNAEDPGLVVLPTHRLVNPRREIGDALHDLDLAMLCRSQSVRGDNEEVLAAMAGSDREHVFGLYSTALPDDGFLLLRIRPSQQLASMMPTGRASDWRELDVAILHEVLLRRCFGLGERDFEDETMVAYTRDVDNARRAVESGVYQLAILLNPTPIEQVLRVAKAGEIMPQKSTYFHPKPLTGLVLHRLNS